MYTLLSLNYWLQGFSESSFGVSVVVFPELEPTRYYPEGK